VVLILIFFNINHRTDKQLLEQKLFVALLAFNALILLLDTAMWLLDGKPGFLLRIIYLFITACYYCLNPVICMLWSFYADYQVFKSGAHLKRILIPMIFPMCINFILSFLSVFKGYMFYIDAHNIYHRGPYFLIMAAMSYFYLMYTLLFIILKQKRIEKHNFAPLLAFALPPFVGGMIQVLIYGVSLIWVCVTISILIIYINIQNHQLYTDYLTGLFNRRQLDNFLQQQSPAIAEERLLAGLMIDLDSFKMINDIYGHDVGDQALKNTAKILKKTFRKNDFISRYGGDEFVVVMDIEESSDLNRAVYRLKENVKQFNGQKIAPYTLSLSVGCDIYTPMPGFTFQHFIKHIDNLMYQEKQKLDTCLKG